MIEHDGRAAPAGDLLDASGDVFGLVVDHVVGAEAAGALKLLGRAGGGDDLCPLPLGDLYARVRDARAGGVDQTHSPGWRAARAISMCQAVTNTTGTAAASAKLSTSGLCRPFRFGTASLSAVPPSRAAPKRANSSPNAVLAPARGIAPD